MRKVHFYARLLTCSAILLMLTGCPEVLTVVYEGNGEPISSLKEGDTRLGSWKIRSNKLVGDSAVDHDGYGTGEQAKREFGVFEAAHGVKPDTASFYPESGEVIEARGFDIVHRSKTNVVTKVSRPDVRHAIEVPAQMIGVWTSASLVNPGVLKSSTQTHMIVTIPESRHIDAKYVGVNSTGWEISQDLDVKEIAYYPRSKRLRLTYATGDKNMSTVWFVLGDKNGTGWLEYSDADKVIHTPMTRKPIPRLLGTLEDPDDGWREHRGGPD